MSITSEGKNPRGLLVKPLRWRRNLFMRSFWRKRDIQNPIADGWMERHTSQNQTIRRKIKEIDIKKSMETTQQEKLK